MVNCLNGLNAGYQNVGFNGQISTNTNARQYMQAPYQNIGIDNDTVQLSTAAAPKKKSKAGVIAKVLGGIAIVGAALFGLKKTGKLTSVENPANLLGKAQNVASKAADYVTKGVDFVLGKGKDLLAKLKGTKVADVAQKAAGTAQSVEEKVINLGIMDRSNFRFY